MFWVMNLTPFMDSEPEDESWGGGEIFKSGSQFGDIRRHLGVKYLLFLTQIYEQDGVIGMSNAEGWKQA